MPKVRNTKSVRLLLSKFEKGSLALSVVDLINELRDSMNRTTVYRVLQRLENEGTLHSFIGAEGLRWYAKWEGAPQTEQKKIHPHFQCEACGKTQCINEDIAIPMVPGHQVESASFLLIGRCANCNDSRSANQ